MYLSLAPFFDSSLPSSLHVPFCCSSSPIPLFYQVWKVLGAPGPVAELALSSTPSHLSCNPRTLTCWPSKRTPLPLLPLPVPTHPYLLAAPVYPPSYLSRAHTPYLLGFPGSPISTLLYPPAHPYPYSPVQPSLTSPDTSPPLPHALDTDVSPAAQ